MLQTNLIFGIQKKIKEGKTQTASGMLEESTTEVPSVPEERAQLIMEGSLNTGIYQQTHSAKKKIVTRSKLVTEAFNMHKVQKKLNKDISFFNCVFRSGNQNIVLCVNHSRCFLQPFNIMSTRA